MYDVEVIVAVGKALEGYVIEYALLDAKDKVEHLVEFERDDDYSSGYRLSYEGHGGIDAVALWNALGYGRYEIIGVSMMRRRKTSMR
jgi:hypothetical protein